MIKEKAGYGSIFLFLLLVTAFVFYRLFIVSILGERFYVWLIFSVGLIITLIILKIKLSKEKFYKVGFFVTLLFLAGNSAYIYQEYAFFRPMAFITNDITWCDKSTWASCNVMEFNLLQWDKSICEGLDKLKVDCLNQYAEINEDPTLCDKEYRDYDRSCIIRLAAIKKDESICKDIPDHLTGPCLSEVAIAKRDLELCRSLEKGSLDSNNCLNSLAVIFNDRAICEEITSKPYGDDEWQKKNCLARFDYSQEFGDYVSDYCPFLGVTRDTCLQELAVKLENTEPCEEMIQIWRQVQCKEAVEAAMEE